MAKGNQIAMPADTGNPINVKSAVVLLAAAALAVVLCLAGCGSSQGGGAGAKVEQKAFPLLFQAEENATPEEGEMNLYFVNGGDIPYVALSEYMPLFGKIYENESLGTKALEFDIAQANGLIRSRAPTPARG